MRFGGRFLTIGLCVDMMFALSGQNFFGFALPTAFMVFRSVRKGRFGLPRLRALSQRALAVHG